MKMIQKKKVFIIGFFCLLFLLSCTQVKKLASNNQTNKFIIKESKKEKIIDAKTELINLIKKAGNFSNVQLSFTETVNLNNTKQIKTINLSYTNDSLKIITNLKLKEKKENVTYTTVNDWGFEVVKDGTYTQCFLDIDVWLCSETKLKKEQVQEVFDEVKDKKFIESIEKVDKITDNCYLINEKLTDCYDENGFLINMTTQNAKIKRNYLKFEKDNFKIPDNSEFII